MDLLTGLGRRSGSSDILNAGWDLAYACAKFDQGQGVARFAVRRLGNVTTSYTVLHSANPGLVSVGAELAFGGRALSCLPRGWCQILMAPSVVVSYYSGPFQGVLSHGSLASQYSFPFVRTPLSLNRQSFVCYLLYLALFVRVFLVPYASPCGRVLRYSERVSYSLPQGYCFLSRGIRVVLVPLWGKPSLFTSLQGGSSLWPSGWARLCREPVSGPPAPCKA